MTRFLTLLAAIAASIAFLGCESTHIPRYDESHQGVLTRSELDHDGNLVLTLSSEDGSQTSTMRAKPGEAKGIGLHTGYMYEVAIDRTTGEYSDVRQTSGTKIAVGEEREIKVEAPAEAIEVGEDSIKTAVNTDGEGVLYENPNPEESLEGYQAIHRISGKISQADIQYDSKADYLGTAQKYTFADGKSILLYNPYAFPIHNGRTCNIEYKYYGKRPYIHRIYVFPGEQAQNAEQTDQGETSTSEVVNDDPAPTPEC